MLVILFINSTLINSSFIYLLFYFLNLSYSQCYNNNINKKTHKFLITIELLKQKSLQKSLQIKDFKIKPK